MKLIIDVPEKIEEYIKDYIPIGAGNNVFCYPDEIARMIQNGTPIPDNATNGDVIKTMFPNTEVDDYDYGKDPVIDVYGIDDTEYITLRKAWWDALYQKGGTNEKQV